MAKWPWIERAFHFDHPPTKFPDILERLRGTPVRITALVEGVPADVLTRRDDQGWSMQENVGHLIDVEPLFMARIDEILAGAAVLTAADITARRTHEANHNARDFAALLGELRDVRGRMVARFEALDEQDWAKASHHPRLDQTMRMVDLAFFTADHDDYHLARIRELVRRLAPPAGGA